MKRDFNAQIIGLDGEVFKDEKKQPLTLRRVVTDALGGQLPGDDAKTGDEKFQLFKLLVRINDGSKNGGVVEIDANELATIKERVGRSWNTLVLGPSYILLETDPPVQTAAPAAATADAAAGATEGASAQ